MNPSRRRFLGSTLPACLAGLGGCATVGDWFGGEDNTQPPAELVDFEPRIELTTLWSRSVGAGADSQYLKLAPAVGGQRVYAANHDGRVSAFDAASGDEVWDQSTDLPISGGPGIGADAVFVGTSNGDVLALGNEDGAVKWRARVSSEVLACPRAAEDVVVIRTIDGKLFGLDAGDGERLWVYDRTVPVLTLRGTSSPALAEGIAVAGFDSGRLVCLALATGQTLWEASVAVPRGRSELERMVDIDADPVIVGNVVYVVSYQGRVAAVDLRNGEVLWRRDMSSHAGLGVDRINVYVTDESSHVWALDRRSSASVWRQTQLQARRLTPPAVFASYVVVGDFEGYVHWLDRDDGSFAARAHVDSSGILAAPVATPEALYVYGAGGELSALKVER
ncbi:MAG: outer membrane protein assembly factor BamB [Gammaproteobacteria bacterium]|nr:outer membrane protein assembly factor BamB [Gammaproteobacteria bacterium]